MTSKSDAPLKAGDPVTLYWSRMRRQSHMHAVFVEFVDSRRYVFLARETTVFLARGTTTGASGRMFDVGVANENRNWIRGHHAEDSEVFRALVSACVLAT